MSQFLVPLVLTDLANVPEKPKPGQLKFYLRGGNLRLVGAKGKELDVVLDRKLDGYTPLPGEITDEDTVFTALQKVRNTGSGSGNAALIRDVPVVGVEVGAVKTGDTLKKGDTLTELMERIMTKRLVQAYTAPSVSLSTVPVKLLHEIGTLLLNVNVKLNFVQADAGQIRAQSITDSVSGISPTGVVVVPQLLITLAPRVFTGQVSYEDGPIKPDNFGDVDPDDPNSIRAGTVMAAPVQFRGVYPILYGSVASPTELPGADLYQISNHLVDDAGNVIVIPSFGTGPRHLWFAVPRLHAPRYNFWMRTNLDAGRIGDPTDLFDSPYTKDVSSSGLHQNWTENYHVYVALSPTEADLVTRLGVGPFS